MSAEKGAGSRMPRVDVSQEVSGAQLEFLRQAERNNATRVHRLRRLRRNNLISGLLLGAGVLSIYAYSMYAVKQERFLDEFDEPTTDVKPQQQ